MKIRPYEKNAKKHPKKQIEQIANSIKEFGMNQPIVVDKQGVIIVGHGRYEALKSLEWTDKQIAEHVKVVDLSEEKAMAYRLADNKLNESDWDMKLVVEDLKLLSYPMIDLTGFDRALVLDDSEKADSVPAVPKEPKSKLGDLYQIGKHRVLCGDSTLQENMHKLFTLDGATLVKADMILTDPPYNVDYTGKTKDSLKIENDKKNDADFLAFLTDAFIAADSVLKPGGVFYIWHADSEGLAFRMAAQRALWTVRQCLVWNKNTMVMGRQDYHWKHEPCLYGWKDGASHLWNSDRTQTTVLNFNRPTKSAQHPTMKPVDLLQYQIGNNTKGEDIILDPFLGSGSTLIAAESSGRICYGLELDPKYVDVIVQRYVDYTGLTEVIKNGLPELWEVSKNTESEEDSDE
jgi:site-specific DNA-methyltransferase (adenine-specific)